VKKKRRAPDEPADGQPHQKHQKRDHQANPGTTNTGLSAKDDPTDKQDYDVIPALPQTVKQTTAYNETDEDVRRKVTFMNDISMHPDDPDRSTTVIRGRDEDRVLTTTKRIKGDQTEQVTLHEVSSTYSSISPGTLDILQVISGFNRRLKLSSVFLAVLKAFISFDCPISMLFTMLTIL
jgi:hypothetical protein